MVSATEKPCNLYHEGGLGDRRCLHYNLESCSSSHGSGEQSRIPETHGVAPCCNLPPGVTDDWARCVKEIGALVVIMGMRAVEECKIPKLSLKSTSTFVVLGEVYDPAPSPTADGQR